MGAYLIAFAKIKDASKLQEYSAAAGPTIIAAGGTVVGRGQLKEVLAGNFDADAGLIAKFSSVAAAHDWYHSSAYQALLPIRDQVMTPTFVVLEEPN